MIKHYHILFVYFLSKLIIMSFMILRKCTSYQPLFFFFYFENLDTQSSETGTYHFYDTFFNNFFSCLVVWLVAFLVLSMVSRWSRMVCILDSNISKHIVLTISNKWTFTKEIYVCLLDNNSKQYV